jgi:ferredoxin--NADP+ reductase
MSQDSPAPHPVEHPIGSAERPLRVAIVGSGPAGFYAADALLKQDERTVLVDMFDRLPTPYGLVRYGVAPDHQSVKGVIKTYEKCAARGSFRFFGNVELGKDLTVDDLVAHYDQICYAVGSATDRRMNIPGEDLGGSHSATAFVGWYNGHPDFRDCEFDLTQESVAVIGVGNVAMDVCRILIRDPDELADTDICEHALAALRESRVRNVWVFGRRGVLQAAFTPKEIKEIGELAGVDLVLRPEDIAVDEAEIEAVDDYSARKNVTYLQDKVDQGEQGEPRKVHLRFQESPAEIFGEDGRVTAIKIEKCKLVPDDEGVPRSRGTGEFETIPVGLVFRSIGYLGAPIPGIPFHERWGLVLNEDGRVLDPDTQKPLPGQYVTGWAKRGPTGLIGTNRGDSVATVRHMIDDLDGRTAETLPADDAVRIETLLSERGIRAVTFDDWKTLDRLEVARGEAKGKLREKFVDIEETLAALDSAGRTEQPSG